jgi:lipocalin-like protein
MLSGQRDQCTAYIEPSYSGRGTVVFAAAGLSHGLAMEPQSAVSFAMGRIQVSGQIPGCRMLRSLNRNKLDVRSTYAGPFRVDVGNGTVTHHVDVSLFPNWQRHDQVRHVTIEGGRLSIIASDQTLADGRTFRSEPIWLRV